MTKEQVQVVLDKLLSVIFTEVAPTEQVDFHLTPTGCYAVVQNEGEPPFVVEPS